MLYEFKSKATGTVTMTGTVAERILAIVGKEASSKGIFTVEQMPDAIAALQAAIDREKRETNVDADDDEDDDDRDEPRPVVVSLAQRAWAADRHAARRAPRRPAGDLGRLTPPSAEPPRDPGRTPLSLAARRPRSGAAPRTFRPSRRPAA
jgi:hypothetical protein